MYNKIRTDLFAYSQKWKTFTHVTNKVKIDSFRTSIGKIQFEPSTAHWDSLSTIREFIAASSYFISLLFQLIEIFLRFYVAIDVKEKDICLMYLSIVYQDGQMGRTDSFDIKCAVKKRKYDRTWFVICFEIKVPVLYFCLKYFSNL